MAASQEMEWLISSSMSMVSMVRALKFFIKVISLSTFWIMKRKKNIYFMMRLRK